MQKLGNPVPMFFDQSGAPLSGGYVYYGVADADPITTPISAFWDEALTIPALQPIRTIGGMAVNGSVPAFVFASGTDYSMRVLDQDGVQVLYSPSVFSDTSQFQQADADLNAIAAQGTQAYGRSLLLLNNQGELQTAVGGTASSAALAMLTPAADKLPYFTGPTGAGLADLSPFVRGLLGKIDAAALASAMQAVHYNAFMPGPNGSVSLALGSQYLIAQWGTYSSSLGEGAYTVPYNFTFPTGCWIFDPWAIIPSSSGSQDIVVQQIGFPGTSSSQVQVQTVSGSGGTLSGVGWFALGN